jgi:hypothetical protein
LTDEQLLNFLQPPTRNPTPNPTSNPTQNMQKNTVKQKELSPEEKKLQIETIFTLAETRTNFWEKKGKNIDQITLSSKFEKWKEKYEQGTITETDISTLFTALFTMP